MSKLWMLPDGMEEALPAQAWRAEALRRTLLDHYREAGYELILPPFVEHLDSLLTGAGADLDGVTFKLTDPASGRLLGLRSDMTPQAARIAARHFADQPVVRLCYLGTVLRTRPDALGGPRSPRQVGCELFGTPPGQSAQQADLEVLALMLDTLRLAGVAEAHLDLGHVGVYRAVVEQLALSGEDETALFDILQRKGLAARVTTDEDIEAAVDTPPQTTRAKLRGEFISAAQEAGRDFTVDWVHLKLNDQAQRTVLCKDPFRSSDERVKRLIASM